MFRAGIGSDSLFRMNCYENLSIKHVFAAWNALILDSSLIVPMFAHQFGWQMGVQTNAEVAAKMESAPNIPVSNHNRFCVFLPMIRAILFLCKQRNAYASRTGAFISRIGSCGERTFMFFFSIRFVCEWLFYQSYRHSNVAHTHIHSNTGKTSTDKWIRCDSTHTHTHTAESSPTSARECCACVKCKYLNSN